MNTQEVIELTGFGIDWVNNHKKEIGCSNVSKAIRLKRKDVEEYMEQITLKLKGGNKKSPGSV